MGFVLLIALFILIQNIYVVQRDYSILNRYNQDNISYLQITQLKKSFVANNNLLNKYFDDSTLYNLANYNESVIEIDKMISGIKDNIHTIDEYLSYKAMQNSFTTYKDEANNAIRAKNYNSFVIPYEANRIYEYTKIYCDELLESSIEHTNTNQNNFISKWKSYKNIKIILIFVIIALLMFIGYVFSGYLTGNIKEIIKMQSKISAGDLEVINTGIHSKDEVGELNRSFNNMQKSIKKKIDDLNEKTIMERRLYQEELRNLEMQKALKDTRFEMLQAQINPHFLFNTLNIISRKVMFDNSEEALKLIQALSELFRNSFRSSSKKISLEKELAIIEEYMYIQKARYGDRIEYILDSHIQSLDHIFIPPLLLQPLVENAMIHGLEPKEGPGLIKITIDEENKKIVIKIEDNGLGMTAERLEEVIANLKNNQQKLSIGIGNVKNRLELFLEREDCFFISSTLNVGTTIKIVMPIDEAALIS
jgi:sensor histidine kinase YesM